MVKLTDRIAVTSTRMLRLTALIICALLYINLYAQNSFAVSVQTGYRFPFMSTSLNPLLENGFFESNKTSRTPNIVDSYGRGGYIGLSASYISRKHIEYGLQVSYSTFPGEFTKVGNENFDKISYSANSIGATPFIRFNKKLRTVTPYVQFGIPLYASEIAIEQTGNDVGNENYYSNQYYPRQLAYGFMFGAGVKKTVSRFFQVIVDVQASGISLKPKTGYFTKGSETSPAVSEKRSLNTKEAREKYGQSISLPISNVSVSLGILWTIN